MVYPTGEACQGTVSSLDIGVWYNAPEAYLGVSADTPFVFLGRAVRDACSDQDQDKRHRDNHG